MLAHEYHCLKHPHLIDSRLVVESKVIGRCTDGRVWTKYSLANGCYFVSTDMLVVRSTKELK